jgi:hypothetical protein
MAALEPADAAAEAVEVAEAVVLSKTRDESEETDDHHDHSY